MFCTNCGNVIEPTTKFCPHCGANRTAEPPPSAAAPGYASAGAAAPNKAGPAASSSGQSRAAKPALWAGAVIIGLASVGGVGYWGWSNKMASEEAARKLASDEAARKAAAEDTARKLADEEQRRIAAEQTAEAARKSTEAAEKAAEAAEITAAQALLDKHIAAEEAQAQANARAPAKPNTQGIPLKR